MAANQSRNGLLQHLRKVAAVHTDRGLSDRELLERFVRARDDCAFTVLIERHGPMVLGVCQRALPDFHEAEDACQAAFLVLARKAASIRRKTSLSSWLHGVACRVAANLKRAHARRKTRERAAGAAAPRDPAAEVTWREVQTVLDVELQRLPERYRTPVVLCHLECMTRDEAAQQLGLSPTTLHGRLQYARGLLRASLTKRGLTLPAAVFAAALGEGVAQAALAPTFVVASARLARLIASGQSLTESAVASRVLAMTQEVAKTMFLTKLKLGAMAVLCTGLFAALISGSWSLLGAQDGKEGPLAERRAAEERVNATPRQMDELKQEAFTAWGQEFETMQVDSGLIPDQITRNEGAETTKGQDPAKPQAPLEDLKVTLPPSISGVVKTPDGKPADNARVTVDLLKRLDAMTGEYDRFRRWQTTTDYKGAYQISTKGLDTVPPSWVFEVYADAKDSPKTRVISVQVKTIARQKRFDDVTFFAGVAVRGRILDPEGRPAKGVYLYQASMIDNSEVWSPSAAPVADDGRFRIVLPSQSDGKVVAAELIAVSTNWAPKRVSLGTGADGNLGDIRLSKGTVLEGRLVDENDKPIAEAIIAARSHDYGQIRNLGNQWTFAAKTNKDGSFRFASPIAEKISLWAADRVEAHGGGEIQLLRSGCPDVFVIPQTIDLGGKAPPSLKLMLRANPTVRIRGTARWADGRPAAGVLVQSILVQGVEEAVVPSRDVFTDSKGRYELKAPKGIEGFSITVGGRLERGVEYVPYPATNEFAGRQTIGGMKFERLDESIDGIDWELRVHGAPRTPEPKESLNPGEAELMDLDLALREKMVRFLKLSEKVKTDKEQIALLHLAPSHDDKLVKSLFELEQKHRGLTTGLMSLEFVMRLAQNGMDPESPAAKGRDRAIAILAENYLAHEDLDLCLEQLRGGTLALGYEKLCAAALKRSPHPHVRAAALLHWATLLNESAGLKTRLPSIFAQLDREPGEINALTRRRLQELKPRVDAVDAPKVLEQAAALAQRVVDEYPKVEMIARIPETGSLLVRRVASAEGQAKTYASQAELLLFELKHLGIGRAAPDFEGEDADKRKLKLSELRGKVVVLMFSANWCLPCKNTYPTLQDLRKKHAGKPLEIVTVMADTDVRTVRQSQGKKEITWLALWDGPSGPIATSWNVQAFPTIYVLDAGGVIRARDLGAIDLPEVVGRLLKETSK